MSKSSTKFSSIAPIAVTMGEPAGVSGEILLKSWERREQDSLSPFYVIDDIERLATLIKKLGFTTPLQPIEKACEATTCFDNALPVKPIKLRAKVTPGSPSLENCKGVIESIDLAIRAALNKEASAMVTGPINKSILAKAGFEYPGHTEYLSSFSSGHTAAMLLIRDLRVVPVTSHLSMKQAVESLSTELIIRTTQVCYQSLISWFGLERPRIAIAALNPHAGEATLLGHEETTIIEPAIHALKTSGVKVRGPLPADSLFHEKARQTYDAAICMYHDQALIPLKTIDFSGGVNLTLGLPIIRTSPDHGTAFDIAGTGAADESSMIAALKLASSLATKQKIGACETPHV